MHLQQHLRQIGPRQQRGDPLAQGDEARRLRQPIQARQHQLVAVAAARDARGGVVREPGGDPAIGGVALLAQRGQFRLRVRCPPQHPQDLRAGRRPGGTGEEFRARITPARARGHEAIATAQGGVRLLAHAERVGAPVDRVAGAADAPPPGRRDGGERRGAQIGRAPPFQLGEGTVNSTRAGGAMRR